MAQSQVAQVIEGRANATDSIINANNLNGQRNKRTGTYDYSHAPDCTQVEINHLSL